MIKMCCFPQETKLKSVHLHDDSSIELSDSQQIEQELINLQKGQWGVWMNFFGHFLCKWGGMYFMAWYTF